MSSISELKSKKSKNKNKLSIKIQKKKVFRATEPLIAVFMWGINHTVRNNNILNKKFISIYLYLFKKIHSAMNCVMLQCQNY